MRPPLDKVPSNPPPPRGSRDEDCSYCKQHKPGDMMPSHDASRHCESGKRSHCTCDVCF